MKAIIVIEIDEKHLFKEMNELYDRLNGYKCELISMPEKFVDKNGGADNGRYYTNDIGYAQGWNACLDSIIGETE